MRDQIKSLSRLLLSLSLSLSSAVLFATDIICGDSSCEETQICARNDVFICSDWNDGKYDGWAISTNKDSSGGNRGDIYDGVGLNGSKGWAQKIKPGYAETIFMDNQQNGINGYKGPLYSRFYVRFSENFQHRMGCGLQKQYYQMWLNDDSTKTRVMLGTDRVNIISKFSNLSSSVGVFAFDWLGHLVEIPDKASDNPVAIYPNRWYSVEFMTSYNSNDETVTVKVWVNGQLQMERTATSEHASWRSGKWSYIHDTSWMGGADDCNKAPEEQIVYKDNAVTSKSYIGPIVGPEPPSNLIVE